MDTGLLKGFAAGARVDLIKEVGARLDVVLGSGSVARAEAPGAVAALEHAVGKDGREAVVDRVAYTWFNRIIALRFMDANGYTGVGVVSPEPGKLSGQPQVLSDAKGGDFDADVISAKTQATVTALLNDTRPSADPQGEAYGLLLEAYCRFWNKAMPFMFEREGDYTELLMPTALLATDSVRDRAVRTLTDEVCGEVEVIGWLYQFYISERKDEVFAGFKKNKKAGAAEIPAATQLFTPHWIVRYLVENSLGRLWLLNHPESQLAEQMDYYIPPVDEETDFLRVSSPEELKIIDPAVGSGHMLTYAFDLLYAIYEEQAYSPSEIPTKILEHNLYGAEIDPRAGALAAFALTMKAAKKRKLFLKNPVQPHVCVLENVRFEQADLDYLWSHTSGSVVRSDSDAFWNAFEHADTFGSLIRSNSHLLAHFRSVVEQLEQSGNLLAAPARRVIEQAEQLSQDYQIVVANPPYMGGSNFSSLLDDFIQHQYTEARADLFAAFILLGERLAKRGGMLAMIAKQNWLFRPAFAELRDELLAKHHLVQVAHFGAGAFDSLPGEIASTAAFLLRFSPARDRLSWFARLTGGDTEVKKELELRAAIGSGVGVFRRSPADFLQVPGKPVCYWMSDGMLASLASGPYMGDALIAREGMATGNNARYLRFWWEVAAANIERGATSRAASAASGKRWFPYNKGGGSRRWYGYDEYVVDWYNDGHELQTKLHPSGKRIWAHNFNLDFIFREAVSWSSITSHGVALRYYPAGYLFDAAGLCAYDRGDRAALYRALALGNSPVGSEVADLLNPTHHFKAGDFARLPLPNVTTADVAPLVDRAIEIARSDWEGTETAPGFGGLSVAPRHSRLAEWSSDVEDAGLKATAELHEVESRLQDLVNASLGEDTTRIDVTAITLNGNPDHAFASAADPQTAQLRARASNLVSYAIGCMFGRYSLDWPGLVLADNGGTLQDYLARVSNPSFIPDADGVVPVVDGEWFEDDVVAKFRQFLRVAFGEEHFEENLKFVIDSLGVKDLRDYFVKSFYKDHVQRYKKRPIYWMFSSPKGSFNALVYLHRYNPSTVSTVLNEYLREFIKKLEVSLEQQERMIVSGANAREVAVAQKEAERLRKVLIELGDYERDLYKLASAQIDLDLDDGVLVNYQKFGAALKDIGLKKGGDSA